MTEPVSLDSLQTRLASLAIGSAELDALHRDKLRALLTRVNDRSPYYREKFRRAGVDPDDFTRATDLQRYPMFDKYEERESQAASLAREGHPLGLHLTCDIRDVNRISASSGTTGTPSFQGHTLNDRRIIFENFARLAAVTDSHPGDRVMMAGVMSMWVAGIPTVDALLDFGANVIPIGGLVGTEKVVEMMQLTRPEVLVGTPSYVRRIAHKAVAEMNVDLASLGVRKLFVYGEPGGSVPDIVAELENAYGGASVYDMAGGTGCLNPIFVSCDAHAGMHFIAPDYAYIELYDRERDIVLPFEDGAEGEFVYTGLDRECGPLIRFMDGDLIRVRLEPCICGLPGMRIAILGRVDDMLLVKGVNVFPTAIRDLVMSSGAAVTGNVKIIKNSDGPVVEPPLQVRVEARGVPEAQGRLALAATIEDEIQRRLRFRAAVEIVDEGKLELRYGPTGKAKLVEVDDGRPA